MTEAIVFLTHSREPRILRHFERLEREAGIDTFLHCDEPSQRWHCPPRYAQMAETGQAVDGGYTDLAFIPPMVALLVDRIQHLVPSSDGGDDFVGIGGPDEGLGIGVGLVEEAVDGGLEVDDRAEDAAFQAPLGQLGEEALDGIEPRAEVGVKWKVQRGWRVEPGADLGVLVGGVVVEDDVDQLAGRDLGLDGVEEADELLMPVALHVAADDRAVEHVERGEQRRGAVASCSRGSWCRRGPSSSAGRAGCGRAPGSGSSRRPRARRHGRADRRRARRRRAACRRSLGSLESLNCRTRCGCSPCARQMRWTELTLMPAALAIIAPVQWVASPGGSVERQSDDALGHLRRRAAGCASGRVLSRSRPSTPSSHEALLPAPDAGLRLAGRGA